ncbi:tyrosine-type recombinase/integrase [Caminibacter pacificus]
MHFSYGINNNPLAYLTLKNIERALGEKYEVTHFKATTNLTDIQDLYKTIKNLKTDLDVKTNKHKTINIYTKFALMFLMLTALQNGTLRRLEWRMVDWDKQIINIPAAITKTKKDFRLPLTDKILKIFEDLKKYGDTGLIFKGKDNKIMSENTLKLKNYLMAKQQCMVLEVLLQQY